MVKEVNEVNEVNELSVEEMRAKIAKLDEENVRLALAEIQAICDKYNVQLVGFAQIQATQMQVVPKR